MTGTTKSNQAYVFHLHTVMRDTALKSTYDSLRAMIPLADSMTRAGEWCAASCSIYIVARER